MISEPKRPSVLNWQLIVNCALVAVAMQTFVACVDTCDIDADCEAGNVCIAGECEPMGNQPSGTDTFFLPNTDTDTDTMWDSTGLISNTDVPGTDGVPSADTESLIDTTDGWGSCYFKGDDYCLEYVGPGWTYEQASGQCKDAGYEWHAGVRCDFSEHCKAMCLKQGEFALNTFYYGSLDYVKSGCESRMGIFVSPCYDPNEEEPSESRTDTAETLDDVLLPTDTTRDVL